MISKMSLSPRVSVIVVNWNGKEDTLECLSHLKESTYPNLGIIVVDNGSIDGSQEAIKGSFPNVKLIENGRNLGYSLASNIGMQAAIQEGSKYVLILNNDIVVHRECVEELVKAIERGPQIGASIPKIYQFRDPKKLEFAWGMIDLRIGLNFKKGSNEVNRKQFDTMRKVNFIPGGASMIRCNALREVGLFDPIYFMSSEDLDLSIRMVRRGYDVVYVPKAKVWHKGTSSLGEFSPTNLYYTTRNRLLFMRRWAKKRHLIIFLLFYFLFYIPRNLVPSLPRWRLKAVRAIFEGIIWNLKVSTVCWSK